MTCPFCLTMGGAEGGTRTRTDCSTRPSNVRGYQLRHLGNDFQRNYLFAGAFAGTAFTGSVFAAAGTAAFASAVFAGAVLVFVSAGAWAGVSGLAESTDTLPVIAGIEISNAERKNAVAAAIVSLDNTVAVPRGPKAALDILLVNRAPASVLPGCSKTVATRTMQERKKIVYRI